MKWVISIPVLVFGVVLSEAQAYQDSEETRPAQTQQPESFETWSVSRVDSLFEFSNGTSICLLGWMKKEYGKQVFTDSVLRDCDTNEDLVYCLPHGGCHLLFSNDTLRVNHIELLAMGENLELVNFPWKIGTFSLEDGSLGYTERINENLRYDEQTIDLILKEYENTEWRTQEEDAEYVSFQLMHLANKLLIAAISGSQESEMKFKEFETRAKPDGANGSWYIIMERVMKYAKGI